MVTPILKWDDIENLQAVVRELRKAGAKTPNCTSQHVHIGVRDFTAKQIANFVRIWYKQEELILKALGTLPSRLVHYTRPTDREFIARLEKSKPTMYLIPLDLAAPPLREWVSNSSEQRGKELPGLDM